MDPDEMMAQIKNQLGGMFSMAQHDSLALEINTDKAIPQFQIIAEKYEDLQDKILAHIKFSKSIYDSLENTYSQMIEFDGQYNSLQFFKSVGKQFHELFNGNYKSLKHIHTINESLKDKYNKEDDGHTRLLHAGLKSMMNESMRLFQGIVSFSDPVKNGYHAIEDYHRTLRVKYQGLEKAIHDDRGMRNMLEKLFGGQPNKKDRFFEKPKKELFNDNCVLTDTLDSIGNYLPTEYEIVVPIKNRTKVIKKLDKIEIEHTSHVWMQIAAKKLYEIS